MLRDGPPTLFLAPPGTGRQHPGRSDASDINAGTKDETAAWASSPSASPDCRILARWVTRLALSGAITKSAVAADPIYRRIMRQIQRVVDAGACMEDLVHLELRQVGRINAVHEEVLDRLHELLPQDPREDGGSSSSGASHGPPSP